MAVNARPSLALGRGWPTWALCGGLLALFLGERVVGHLPRARLVLSGLGALAVLGAAGARAALFARSTGARRRVERLLLLGAVGCLVALAFYLAGSADGIRWLGLKFATPAKLAKWQGVFHVLWPIVLTASLLPLIAATWAAGGARGGTGAPAEVESFRAGEAAASGLTVAFAGATLFLFCYVAAERDHKVDLSYFRTSMPGSATESMVGSLSEPLRVLLFFPQVNEVKDEVTSYFRALADATGRVEIEHHDRLANPALAKDYKVMRDGAVVLVRGTRSETITVDPDLAKAKNTLRTFDGEVQKAFMKVARGARVAYLTVGHGEMNESSGPSADPLASVALVKEQITRQNYKAQSLGLKDGLGREVPDDAAMVIVLGPKEPFLDEELAALDRYLQRGGSLLLALHPETKFVLGPLEARLGVKFDAAPLCDDEQHMTARNNATDNRLVVTDQFSSHASVTTLSHARVNIGILVPFGGSIVEVEPAPGVEAPKRTHVVRSRASSFSDRNGNNTFDPEEKRGSANVITAVEGPTPTAEPGAPAPARGFRAWVVADAPMLSDPVLARVKLNYDLAGDGVKWLGGEEAYAGSTTSEKDVEIQHTKSQDVAWFYSTIAGAPVLVLAAGLGLVWRRRRSRGGRAS